jgi:esterase/lipase superfamily enzyme
MQASPAPTPTVQELLARLAAAVHAGDRERARALAQELLRLLAEDAVRREADELQVRALLRALEAADAGPQSFSDADDGDDFPVWFGTNRRPAGDGFSHERHHAVTLGRVFVRVPAAHRAGELGGSWWTRLRRLDLRDDRLRVERVEPRDRAAVFAELRDVAAGVRADGQAPHALVFLHGYCNTFEDAAIRAAQLGHDLEVPGPTAFFSWPSRGKLTAYPADEAAIEASEPAIAEFLVDFAAHCGAEKVHVIAHSMGNRGFLRALQRIAADAETRGRVRFGQVFLAAPDVDRDLFLDLARLYREHSERTTLYASRGDLAVHVSARLHDAPRAGYLEPYTVAAGVDTVVVPDFDLDLLGHSYFAQAERLLGDLRELMRRGTPAARRAHIDPLVHAAGTMWALRPR